MAQLISLFFLLALASPQGKLLGSIVKLTGNHMPTTATQGSPGKTIPLAVPIYIFRGKVRAKPGLGAPKPTDPRVISVVKSRADGTFEATLPPGTYTVFALIGETLYSNSFDGLDNFTSINVGAGREAHIHIKDVREATF